MALKPVYQSLTTAGKAILYATTQHQDEAHGGKLVPRCDICLKFMELSQHLHQLLDLYTVRAQEGAKQ